MAPWTYEVGNPTTTGRVAARKKHQAQKFSCSPGVRDRPATCVMNGDLDRVVSPVTLSGRLVLRMAR